MLNKVIRIFPADKGWRKSQVKPHLLKRVSWPEIWVTAYNGGFIGSPDASPMLKEEDQSTVRYEFAELSDKTLEGILI